MADCLRLKIFDDNHEVDLSEVVAALKDSSRSEAQRLMKQGGVTLFRVNISIPDYKYVYESRDVIKDPKFRLRCTEDDLFIVKIGKRKFFQLSSLLGDLFAHELSL